MKSRKETDTNACTLYGNCNREPLITEGGKAAVDSGKTMLCTAYTLTPIQPDP